MGAPTAASHVSRLLKSRPRDPKPAPSAAWHDPSWLDTVGAWAQQHRIGFTTYADLSSKPEVVALISEWVDQVNVELAQVETIKRFSLLPKELDEEDGEVTATQKVKRRAIEAAFATTIQELYA